MRSTQQIGAKGRTKLGGIECGPFASQLGSVRASLGHAAEGVAMIQEGISGLRKSGTHLLLSAAILGLAEPQALEGAIEDAFDTIEQALTSGRNVGTVVDIIR